MAPDVVEEVKWRKPSNSLGVPTWSHAGILCTGETYKDKIRLTCARVAALEDSSGLFNAALTPAPAEAWISARATRSTNRAFKAPIREAVALSLAHKEA